MPNAFQAIEMSWGLVKDSEKIAWVQKQMEIERPARFGIDILVPRS